MVVTRIATRDPALTAFVETRAPLHYVDGADDLLDRPAHVRAASGLARLGGRVALIQDDSNFVAVIDPGASAVRGITLPAGEGGRRQFDEQRGNKRHKLDLEACVGIDAGDGPTLIAFGSGSTSDRERVVIVDEALGPTPRVSVVHVPLLYEALRREAAFAGSELNVEGAIALGETVRLFGRGNGARRGDRVPANATCDLDQARLIAHLRAPRRVPPPPPTRVVRYELGSLGSVPLGFTDASAWGDAILYSAAAEDSPDTVRDGTVIGSAIGVVDAAGRARWTPLLDAGARPYGEKVEGLSAWPADANRLLAVVDSDDPDDPSALCTIVLRGPWRARG